MSTVAIWTSPRTTALDIGPFDSKEARALVRDRLPGAFAHLPSAGTSPTPRRCRRAGKDDAGLALVLRILELLPGGRRRLGSLPSCRRARRRRACAATGSAAASTSHPTWLVAAAESAHSDALIRSISIRSAMSTTSCGQLAGCGFSLDARQEASARRAHDINLDAGSAQRTPWPGSARCRARRRCRATACLPSSPHRRVPWDSSPARRRCGKARKQKRQRSLPGWLELSFPPGAGADFVAANERASSWLKRLERVNYNNRRLRVKLRIHLA